MMRRFWFLGPALAALLLVSGCTASGFRADVTRFHNMPAPYNGGAGEGVLIEPLDPEKAGLQFAAYADVVGAHLGALGYQPAKDTTPQIIARIDYSITEQPAIRDDSGPRIGVGLGGGSRHVGGGISTSFNLGGGPKPVYLSRLLVVLVAKDSGQVLFEGSAQNLGKNPDLSALIPLLAEALFTGFPGVSGSSERIEVPTQ